VGLLFSAVVAPRLREGARVADDARCLRVSEEGRAAVELPPGGYQLGRHGVGAVARDGGEDGPDLLRDDGREGVCRVRGGAGQPAEAAMVGFGEVAGGEREEDDAGEEEESQVRVRGNS